MDIGAALVVFNKAMPWLGHSIEHLVGELLVVVSTPATRAAGVVVGDEDGEDDAAGAMPCASR